jgi:periplasmic copper chaperone A
MPTSSPATTLFRCLRRATPCAALLLAAAGPAPSLSLSHGWFRMLTPQIPAAGYFTLNNSGATPAELVGAASPACGMLMLHRSVDNSGMESMADVADVAVPPHGSVSFSPGGYHLMCMSPQPAMKLGANVPVTLSFQDGTKLDASFVVRNARGQ